jgi:hypothetical protein
VESVLRASTTNNTNLQLNFQDTSTGFTKPKRFRVNHEL